MAAEDFLSKWQHLFMVALLVVALGLWSGVGVAPQVPWYLIFGDSLVDNENNNQLQSLARANQLPYGIDSPSGPSTRFSNGKTTVDAIGISRSIVEAPPAHYVVKIQSFSLLTKNSVERYESGKFEAGGYKWKLVLYPSGNKSKNVRDHISLYLALDEPGSLRLGWEIYVNFRLFLFDQNNDNYLVVQEQGSLTIFGILHLIDAMRKERRFHKMKVEWGFDQFIPLKDFNQSSKGYLVDDVCAFGAEVYVCRERSTGKGESLTMMKDVITYKHVWEINNFSKLDSECYDSKPFNAGNYKWKIKLYPYGKGAELGSYLSLYLALANPTALSPGSKIYARIILRILDQKQAKHHFGKANYWFSASNHENGASRFLFIRNFTSQYLGYLVKDTCLVEAEVTILGVVDALS